MVLSIDIGGTNIRSGLVVGAKIDRYAKTPTPKTKSKILNKLFQIIESYPKETICISTAGFERGGKIIHALNMDFNNVFLGAILRGKFRGRKVYIENDGNCAALAELY